MIGLSNMLKKRLKIFTISIILFLLSALPVLAENEWSLQLTWPTSPGPDGGRELTTESTIAELVAYFYEWGVFIGILIFFGILIYAGFKYLTSTGDPGKLKDAKKRIISGFSGVILLLGSYLILNAINPELTQIREVSPSMQRMGSHEFSSGMLDDQNLCEFAFTTVQEDDDVADEETTHFLIPSLARETDEVFPIRSKACTAERDDDQILEVRENDMEEEWILVYSLSGEEYDKDERVPFDGEKDDLYDLYAKRYEKIDETITIDSGDEEEKEFFKTLETARETNSYNLFTSSEDCEENIIGNKNFNRPRCLELDGTTITEWRRKGYASLIKALNTVIGDGSPANPDGVIDCPDANQMGDILGYKRDSTGGGCSIAFYDGEEKRWLRDDIVTCSEQISRPSADMNTFDGLVDRETNCLELNRYEPPLDIELEEFRNKVTVRNEFDPGAISICKGHSDRCITTESYRSCNTTNDCSETIYLLPEGDYTIEGFSDTSAVSFEEYGPEDDGCEIYDFNGHNPEAIICNIDLEEDREFTLEEK